MKSRIYYPLYLALVGSLALLFVASCASVPRKEKALQVYQSIHASISSVQDAERLLCLPDATTPTHCTSTLAPKLGLTDAKHVDINAKLVKAFALEIQVGTALKAWRAGDPAPHGLSELSTVANEVLTVASALTDDADVRRIIASAKALLDTIAALTASLGVK